MNNIMEYETIDLTGTCDSCMTEGINCSCSFGLMGMRTVVEQEKDNQSVAEFHGMYDSNFLDLSQKKTTMVEPQKNNQYKDNLNLLGLHEAVLHASLKTTPATSPGYNMKGRRRRRSERFPSKTVRDDRKNSSNVIHPGLSSQTNPLYDYIVYNGRHLLFKKSEMLFKCPFCFKTYSKPSDLIYHIVQVHGSEEERKNDCPFCGKEFRDSLWLQGHIKDAHNTDRCEGCEYISGSIGLLKCWYHRTFGTPVFSCSLCKYDCEERSVMMRHVLTTHANISLKYCKKCPYVTTYKTMIAYHTDTRHNLNMNQFKIKRPWSL